MRSRWLLAIVSLPLPVTVLIPAAVVLVFRGSRWAHVSPSPSSPALWLGVVAGVIGLALAGWSASVFARFGDGTPAPWDPPARFVARGPYRHVRNPMILGVFFILLGEALVLRSWPLFAWFLLFAAANSAYIPWIEERGLERRFGDDYLRYKAAVPRWLPRWTPWRPENTGRR